MSCTKATNEIPTYNFEAGNHLAWSESFDIENTDGTTYTAPTAATGYVRDSDGTIVKTITGSSVQSGTYAVVTYEMTASDMVSLMDIGEYDFIFTVTENGLEKPFLSGKLTVVDSANVAGV